jgi:imidazole glycerol-phosphate synthase subunit HisH
VGRIAVLDYDSGNLHSVSRAIVKVGGDVDVTSDPARVASAAALVIPGVGHFGQCVRALGERGLDRAARDFAATGRPVLGVCVGLQVLFDASEEDAVAGMGVLGGTVRRLPDGMKVPHMGWNTVRWVREHPFTAGIDDGSYFYFVHSFAPDVDDAATVGVTEYGRPFASVLARDNVFATQFHPEKSGESGLQLYENVVKVVASA